jgi:hypothetical protein
MVNNHSKPKGDMMEKISITAREEPKTIKFDFYGQIIEVKPYLSLSEKGAIIQSYVDEMFFDRENNIIIQLDADRFRAEERLKYSVLDIMTNIDTSSLDMGTFYMDELFQVVVDKIVNYQSLRTLLDDIVEDYNREQVIKTSVGTVLDNMLSVVLNTLNDLKVMTPDKLEEFTAKNQELILQAQELSNPKPKKVRRHVKK